MMAVEVIPPDLLSPSTLFSAGGWMAMGAAILLSVQRGWFIPKTTHEREIGILKDTIKIKEEQYSAMVSLKDKAYQDMLLIKNEQLVDQRGQTVDWKSAAMSADTRADILAHNQAELMSGIQVAVQFIEQIHNRNQGGQS